MLQKGDLLECLEVAYKECYPFFGVFIQVKDSEKPEMVMFPYENFKDKSKYYDTAYNENLELYSCSEIKIVGWETGSFYDVAHAYACRGCEYCD